MTTKKFANIGVIPEVRARINAWARNATPRHDRRVSAGEVVAAAFAVAERHPEELDAELNQPTA